MANVARNFSDSDRTDTHTDNAPSWIRAMATAMDTTRITARDGNDMFITP